MHEELTMSLKNQVRAKKHKKSSGYNPNLVTVQERVEERSDEGAGSAGSQARDEEEGSKEAVAAVADHNLDIHFEAGGAEIEYGDGEEHCEDGGNNHQEVHDDGDEDTFYDLEGVFDYGDDIFDYEDDIYHEMVDNER
jgi:hypothetical protein